MPVAAKKERAKVVPLAKGEVRQEIRNTWRMMGLIGLKWRAIVHRAIRG